MDNYDFGDWVSDRRGVLNKLSRKKLASLTSYSYSSIRKIESNERYPDVSGALQLANALQVPSTHSLLFVEVARRIRSITELPPAWQLDAAGWPKQKSPNAIYGDSYARYILGGMTTELENERKDPLIGMDKELNTVIDLLDAQIPVAIQGFSGNGKTRLVIEVTYNYLSTNTFPVLWVKVSQGSVDYLLSLIGQACEITQLLVGKSIYGRIRTLRNALEEKHIGLVVFDDVPDAQMFTILTGVVPLEANIIVTSVARFEPKNSKSVSLKGLNKIDARSALSYYARGKTFPIDTVDELCQMLNYSPYAIKIVGKDLNILTLSLKQYLKKVENSRVLSHSAEGSERSISLAIDLSVNALESERVRHLFKMLGSIFIPSVTDSLFQIFSNELLIDVNNAFIDLYMRGLVERIYVDDKGLTHYHLHNLMHNYIRSTYKEELDTARFVNACLIYVKRHRKELWALDAERGNLLKAATYADDQQIIDFMMSLAVDTSYCDSRGYTVELLDAIDHAITLLDTYNAKSEIEWRQLHFLLCKRGNAYRSTGDPYDALTCYEKAIVIAEYLSAQHDMAERQCIVLAAIGTIHAADLHDPHTAHLALRRAHYIAKRYKDDELMRRVLENTAVYYAEGLENHPTALNAARRIYKSDLALAKKLQHPEAIFHALNGLANVLYEQFKKNQDIEYFHQAIPYLREAWGIAWRENSPRLRADALYSLGLWYSLIAQHRCGAAFLGRARLLFKRCGMYGLQKEVEKEMASHHYPLSKS